MRRASLPDFPAGLDAPGVCSALFRARDRPPSTFRPFIVPLLVGYRKLAVLDGAGVARPSAGPSPGWDGWMTAGRPQYEHRPVGEWGRGGSGRRPPSPHRRSHASHVGAMSCAFSVANSTAALPAVPATCFMQPFCKLATLASSNPSRVGSKTRAVRVRLIAGAARHSTKYGVASSAYGWTTGFPFC